MASQTTPALRFSSKTENIWDSIMRHSHWNAGNREALIPGPLSSARCSGLLFHVSSQVTAVNTHINVKDPSSKLIQLLSTIRTTCKPPCSAPWGCRTALTSGTGHLSPSGDQDKATSYRTQAEQRTPPTLQLFIMGAQLHKPFHTTQTCPTLFVTLSAWNISLSCADQGPDPLLRQGRLHTSWSRTNFDVLTCGCTSGKDLAEPPRSSSA